MISDKDIERFEQNFRDIFSKLNGLVPSSVFITTFIVVIGFWGSLFGLMYADLQEHKRLATIERVVVIEKLSEVKIAIEQIRK